MVWCIFEFLKRNRRRIFIAGAVSGGALLLYKYVQKKLKEIQEKEAEACLIFARKQHHFDCNQRTCNRTALSMLPTIREVLICALNTDVLKDELKTSSKNKIEKWEELKVMSFTRTICTVYVCSMLVVLLRVQLNIIGGYIYCDNFITRNEIGTQFTEIQERYLCLLKHITSEGLKNLISHVQKAVIKEIGNISLRETLSMKDVSSIIKKVRLTVEVGPDEVGKVCTNPSRLALVSFMLPAENVETDLEFTAVSSPVDQFYDKMVYETRDIIDSEDFQTVLRSCVDKGFAHLLNRLEENLIQQQERSPMKKNETVIPMAKFIPIINQVMFRLSCNPPNAFFQELLLMDQIRTLAANVYEAFSQEKS